MSHGTHSFHRVFLCLLRRGFYLAREIKKLPPIKVGAVSILHLATKKDDRFNRHRLRSVALSFQYLVKLMVRVSGFEPHFSATPDWIRTPHILTEPRGVEPLAIINSHARNCHCTTKKIVLFGFFTICIALPKSFEKSDPAVPASLRQYKWLL